MRPTAPPTRILITVMTYPHPSRRYEELVCTAGVTEEGEWIRLYPVDYRYRPLDQRFHKYQWIEVELSERGADNDPRRESRIPRLESIRVIGKPLPTGRDWEARRRIIDPLPHHTLNQLKELYSREKISLGIVRPKRVLDMEVRPADREWKPQWEVNFTQLRLFGPPPKPLRKIPYTFHYVFECEDNNRSHKAMVEDWELGVLFLKEAGRLGDDKKAAQSVKDKFMGELCGPDRDTRFFMGTRFPYNVWLVLGVFYPPKAPCRQEDLFRHL